MNKTKLLRITILFLMTSISVMVWSKTYSGSCGPNAFWEYNTSTKRLSITGRGEMNDYNDSDNTPWHEYHSKIENISISHGITKIGKYAFCFCNFSSVNIPSSVTRIEEDAFWGCDNLTSVWIPNSVSYLDTQAFIYCDKLSAINVSSDNPNYTSVNGVVFSKDKTTLYLFPSGKDGYYSIPEHVTCIGYNAFYTSIVSTVYIPNTVREIEKGAFSFCKKLNNITLPKSISIIKASTFFYCLSLESITIPSSVTEIGQTAFGNCSKLAHVYIQSKAGSVKLGKDAFPEATQIHYTGSSAPAASASTKKSVQNTPVKKGLSKDYNEPNGSANTSKPAQQSSSKKPLSK